MSNNDVMNVWSKEDQNEGMIDEDLVLSEHAIIALKEFYEEKCKNSFNDDCDQQNDGNVEEDWQLSQFWYSEETADYLSDEVIHAIEHLPQNKSIACISCPTLFTKLLNKLSSGDDKSIELHLLEFDRRFETKYPSNFTFYDYNQPISSELKTKFNENSIDCVIADPPFLSEECMEKVIETIKYLSNDKILVCSGAVMADILKECLHLEQCEHFIPKHERHLGNEFGCFSNFPLTVSPK